MMRSLFSGVSGLKSHQTRMDVIGNNIANINTVGFKSSRVTFSDMLSQTTRGAAGVTTTLGGTNPLQIGLGAAVASIDLITSDGSPQSTGKNTDVALSGNGMFVLKNGDQYYYSRDGAFEFDEQGNYVLPGSGLYVQGWNAVDGSLNTNSDPTNIVVPAGRSMEASATSTVDFSGNLNASAPTIQSISYTQGGAGAVPSRVVKQEFENDITGIDYNYTFTVTNTATGLTSPKAYNVGDTLVVDGISGTLTTLVLSLEDTSTGATSVVTETSAIPVAVGVDSYFSIAPPLKVTGVTATYTSSATVSDTDSYYVGKPLSDSNTTSTKVAEETVTQSPIVSSVTLTLDDGRTTDVKSSDATRYRLSTVAESDATDADSTGLYVAGETASVNVDGTNVIAAVLTLSDGTTQKVTSGFYEVGHSMPITTIVTLYDSEGKKHAVTVLLDKDPVSTDDSAAANPDKTALGTDNRWRVYIAPAAGERGPSHQFENEEDDGSLTTGYFNPTEDSDGTMTGAVSYIYFNTDGSYSSAATDGGSLYLTYSNGNGAASTTSSVNFTGLTQFAGSSTAYPTADGNSFGVLQSVSIDSSGILTGTYTNGTRRFEAQIAVAQFINSAGLTKTGTSLYQESNNSGAANVKTVTDLGLLITPSALEMSNVDLASELADMIVTQRGFQSNSKTITVGDEMLETLINMKR